MESYHTVLEAIASSQKQGVLAIIIRVDGSAYQKEGAYMFIDEDGHTFGLLSGGCLEEAVAIEAKKAWQNECATIITFDLTQEDDLSWGQGAGCNGVVHILLQPITERIRADLLAVKTHLDQGRHVLLARKLDETTDDYFNWLFLTEDGYRLGGFQEEVPAQMWEWLHTAPPFHSQSGICTIADTPFYIQHYWPKPRLVIFGANLDVKPLISFAKQVGFSVTVADWRPAFCCPEQLPDADQWVVGFPHETIPELHLCKHDFVVIMTHHFQRDQEIIKLLRDQPLYYLGVLGPKRRTTRLFSGSLIPPSIHSPVGLSIGARGPEEIAISITAEMISVLRNGSKGGIQ
ncbi:XdhC family protein [Anoxybacteroides tepidamans]|uniref:XdhC family protein n=1 Tax=Anoxybacteroides tepidamans TaxID=265948 RepID=UPI00047FF8C5|nr:XdhC family protein [Anoxybacillus tepidamans]